MYVYQCAKEPLANERQLEIEYLFRARVIFVISNIGLKFDIVIHIFMNIYNSDTKAIYIYGKLVC